MKYPSILLCSGILKHIFYAVCLHEVDVHREIKYTWGETKQLVLGNWVPGGYTVVWYSVAKPSLTLGNTVDCSPPGSSVHGIFQARILEWVVVSFSRVPS